MGGSHEVQPLGELVGGCRLDAELTDGPLDVCEPLDNLSNPRISLVEALRHPVALSIDLDPEISQAIEEREQAIRGPDVHPRGEL